MSEKKRLFSGIQPTGDIHIGNYLGAIKNWVKFQDDYESIISVVPYHAMTIKYDAKEFRKNTLNTAAMLLAIGIDPDKAKLFIQSDINEHCELAWMFGTVISLGHLERMTQFKDKSSRNEENINTGLFTYPILQTADIALYKAEIVPVGEDQVQHIELAREIIRRFNNRFGDIFPEPFEKVGEAKRIMGLDGKAKMSKSLGNAISLTDSPEEIAAKIKLAVTDASRLRLKDPGNPSECKLYNLHKFFCSKDVLAQINTECPKAEIGCVVCKKFLTDALVAELSPIRERYLDIISDYGELENILAKGADKLRPIAQSTMEEVRRAAGLI